MVPKKALELLEVMETAQQVKTKPKPSTFAYEKKNHALTMRKCKQVTHNTFKIQYVRKTHPQNVQSGNPEYFYGDHPYSCLFLTFLSHSLLDYQFSLITTSGMFSHQTMAAAPVLHIFPYEPSLSVTIKLNHYPSCHSGISVFCSLCLIL